MSIQTWDQRHRSIERLGEAAPLVVETARRMKPGRALDLACGTGRNALWLAEHAWSVTAVDGSPAAIEMLRNRAGGLGLHVDARVADLEKGEYNIEPSAWELIVVFLYLQRELFEPAKLGVVPGGALIAVTLLAEEPANHRLTPGELEGYFSGWEILHRYEGGGVAEIVARHGNR